MVRPRKRTAASLVAKRTRLRSPQAGKVATGALRFAARAMVSPVDRSVFDHPAHEFRETVAGMDGKIGYQRSAGHARLGVDFENDGLGLRTARVVITEVGARDTAAAQGPVGHQRIFLALPVDVVGDVGGENVLGAARRIFRDVIVESTLRYDVDD